jgi:hypothetical protein
MAWNRFLVFLCLLRSILTSQNLQINVNIDTDPEIVTRESCHGKRRPCERLVHSLIEREKFHLFGTPRTGWRYDEICQ